MNHKPIETGKKVKISSEKEIVLKTEKLTKVFDEHRLSPFQKTSFLTAVNQVGFSMYRGELLGLLGESGCGKSTLAGMLMHLLKPTSGKIYLKGQEIQEMSEAEFRKKRKQIQMIYQNPFDSLDPTMRIGRLLEEPMRIWMPELTQDMRTERIRKMLTDCGLPEDCVIKYPGEFSGGQLQRISIARALLIEPEILIADEIISALDVSIQNQILQLLIQMKEKYQLSILFITHDLSVAKKMSDRVMVMREGKIREIGAPEKVFAESTDPYVRELESAVFTFSGRVREFEDSSACTGSGHPL